jgi:hypothetical protein
MVSTRSKFSSSKVCLCRKFVAKSILETIYSSFIKPINTYFKHFEEPSSEQEQEKKQWEMEEKSLLKALRESVDKAFERKKLSNQQAIKYFQSSNISIRFNEL